MTKFKICFCYILICFLPLCCLESSNFHEHLFSLPLPSNLATAAPAIFSLPTSVQNLSQFFVDETALLSYLESKWQKDVCQRFMNNGGYFKTLAQLCEELPGYAHENLERFLTLNISSHICQNRQRYILLENMRKNILLALPIESFCAIFEDYFRNEALVDRTFISAAVTRRFFGADQKGKHLALQKLAQDYQTKLVYRVSLQRQDLLKNGVDFDASILEMLSSHQIAAIDVVGSISEAIKTDDSRGIDFNLENILELFHLAADYSEIIVLHIFEGRQSGHFYKLLKEALNSFKRPLHIEIGHIAHLTTEWLDIFSSHSHFDVLFHVNVQSNCLLQGTDILQLVNKVALIKNYGFKVVPGCDGRGILPASSYREQIAHFPFSLDNESFLSQSHEKGKV